jgi:hypothetical protein
MAYYVLFTANNELEYAQYIPPRLEAPTLICGKGEDL